MMNYERREVHVNSGYGLRLPARARTVKSKGYFVSATFIYVIAAVQVA